MDPAAILSLISQLFAQLTAAQQEIEALRLRLAEMTPDDGQ